MSDQVDKLANSRLTTDALPVSFSVASTNDDFANRIS